MAAEPMACVIVTCGRPDLLRRLLESVVASGDADLLSRLLVCEVGGRTDGEAVCRDFAGRLPIEYARQEDSRKTVALNAAVRDVATGLVVFLDDDVRLEPGFFSAYAAAAAEHPRAYFGGPFRVDRPQPPPAWLEPFLPPSAQGRETIGVEEVRFPRFFLGFNWAARAEDLLTAGGFDERLGPGTDVPLGDESFMQEALNETGLVGREVSGAVVWHYVPPERCDAPWVLRRTKAGGVTRGKALAADRPHHSRWRLVLSELRRLTRRHGGAGLMAASQRGRFLRRYLLRRLAGVAAGAGSIKIG